LYRFAVTTWNQKGESDYSQSFAHIYDSDSSRSAHYVNKGNEMMRSGAFQDAYIYFSTAIRLDPQNAGAYEGRARVNEKFDRLDLASQDYARAEKISSH
jgi:Tfp pilus assembly protein PilF